MRHHANKQFQISVIMRNNATRPTEHSGIIPAPAVYRLVSSFVAWLLDLGSPANEECHDSPYLSRVNILQETLVWVYVRWAILSPDRGVGCNIFMTNDPTRKPK